MNYRTQSTPGLLRALQNHRDRIAQIETELAAREGREKRKPGPLRRRPPDLSFWVAEERKIGRTLNSIAAELGVTRQAVLWRIRSVERWTEDHDNALAAGSAGLF